MGRLLWPALLVLATVAVTAHAALTLENTQSILEAAVKFAQTTYPAPNAVNFAVVVLDEHGTLAGMYRMDDAALGVIDVATKKARTAALFHVPSSTTGQGASRIGGESFGLELSNGGLVSFGGGFPLIDAGVVIGAVGVSGGSVDQDEAVAQAALVGLSKQPDLNWPIVVPPGGEVFGSGVNLNEAFQALKAAAAHAAAEGLAASIAIVDSGAHLKGFWRMDGAPIGSIDLAIGKARQSKLFNVTSEYIVGQSAPTAGSAWRFEYVTREEGGTSFLPGGLPIVTPDDLANVGGIGVDVGNLTAPTVNIAIAKAGLAAFIPHSQGTFAEREGLTLAATQNALMAAVAKANEVGKPMDIVVLSSTGHLKGLYRMDGSCLACLDVAWKKAKTAALFRMASAQLGLYSHGPNVTDGALWRIEDTNGGLISFGGGYPIFNTFGKFIGSIGASSGSVEQDEQVAEAGKEAAGVADVVANVIPAAKDCKLSLDLAFNALTAAVAAKVGPALQIMVQDNAGRVKAFWGQDGAPLGSIEVAHKKAFTSATSGYFTSGFGGGSFPAGQLYGIEVSNGGLVTFDGGVPIQRGGALIGAIGASGGSGQQDEQAAKAGVALIQAAPCPAFQITLAQTQAVLEYGVKAAVASNKAFAFAVVDTHGALRGFYRMDSTVRGVIDIATKKAKTAALFGVKTQLIGKEASRIGGISFGIELTNGGLVTFGGGVPIFGSDGVLIGAVGASGGTAEDDQLVAETAAAALYKTYDPLYFPDEGAIYGCHMHLHQAIGVLNASLAQAKRIDRAGSIAIVDTGANLKAFWRMDGAPIGSIDLAIRKARQSRLFPVPSEYLVQNMVPADDSFWRFEYASQEDGGTAFLAGGLTLHHLTHNKPVGAVGVDVGDALNTTANKIIAQAGVLAWNPDPIYESERNEITLAQAQTALMAAVAKAVELKAPMDIVVLSSTGHLKALYRMDGSCLGCLDVALKKARTAGFFEGNSSVLSQYSRPAPAYTDGPLWRIEDTNGGLITFGGGYPIFINGSLIGSIGASSGFVPQDELVAEAGRDAIYHGLHIPNSIPETNDCGLGLSVAFAGLQAAWTRSQQDDSAHMDIAIYDASGRVKAVWVSDEVAYLGSIEVAQLKARTSAMFGQNTDGFGTATWPTGVLYGVEVANGGMVTFPGGVSVKRGAIHIGGVGASGGLNAQDAAVAQAAATAIAALTCPVAPLPAPVLTLNMTIAVLEGAIKEAVKGGGLFAIAVSDAAGHLTGFYRMDGAGIGMNDIAFKKMKTSALFGVATQTIGATASRIGAPAFGIELTNGGLVTFPGGQPLKNSAGVVIGAVGVSGGTPQSTSLDVAIAAAAAINGQPDPAWVAPAGDITGSGIELQRALRVLRASFASAHAAGKASSLAVVDSAARLKAFWRMDGALTGTIDLAIRKARTSRLFNADSNALLGYMGTAGPLWRFEYAVQSEGGVSFAAGGLPLLGINSTLGAIGVDDGNVTHPESNIPAAKAGVAAFAIVDVLPSIRDGLSLDQAKAGLMAAVAKAVEIGAPMDIVILSATGHLKALYRMDGSCLGCMDVAWKKAKTALYWKTNSSVMAQDSIPYPTATDGRLWRLQDLNGGLVTFGGGFSIFNGQGHCIGAIGVSSGAVSQDEAVAIAGVKGVLQYSEGARATVSAIPPATSNTNCTLTLSHVFNGLQAAFAKADAIKVPMDVAFTDAGGRLKAFWAHDHTAYLGSIEVAQRKAFGSSMIGQPTDGFGKATLPGGPIYGIEVAHDGLVSFSGGLPLFRGLGGKNLVGGVGASGGLPDQDLAVATAGAELVNVNECFLPPTPPTPQPCPTPTESSEGMQVGPVIGIAGGAFVAGLVLMGGVMRIRTGPRHRGLDEELVGVAAAQATLD